MFTFIKHITWLRNLPPWQSYTYRISWAWQCIHNKGYIMQCGSHWYTVTLQSISRGVKGYFFTWRLISFYIIFYVKREMVVLIHFKRVWTISCDRWRTNLIAVKHDRGAIPCENKYSVIRIFWSVIKLKSQLPIPFRLNNSTLYFFS